MVVSAKIVCGFSSGYMTRPQVPLVITNVG